MRVVILYNDPLPSAYDQLGEGLAVDSIRVVVAAVEAALRSGGHEVSLAGVRPPMAEVVATLRRTDVDLVFNLFEGFDGCSETEWQMAEALEEAKIPFTGASATTLALCLNKGRAKKALMASRLPTPPFQLLSAQDVVNASLEFPLIVKPLQEDASHGLRAESVVYDTTSLLEQVFRTESNFGSPVLVESFLAGKEFNVSVLGQREPRILPPSEIVYTEEMPGAPILTFAAKWFPDDPAYKASVVVCPARIPASVWRRIESLALRSHKAVGAPPYARVDIRADISGKLHILEVNPNPDLEPGVSIARQAEAAGISYAGLIEAIVGMAMEEKSIDGRWVASHAS